MDAAARLEDEWSGDIKTDESGSADVMEEVQSKGMTMWTM